MALSRLKITFSEEMTNEDDIDILMNRGGVLTDYWFTYGSANPETDYVVPIGTPTGTAGEITATNLVTSFDTNVNGTSDFIVSSSANVVTITANSSDDYFGLVLGTDNKFTYVVDAVPGGGGLPTYYDAVNIRSPLFEVAPIYDGSVLVSPNEVTFDLKTWKDNIISGQLLAKEYQYVKQPLFLGDNKIYITIDKQVSDVIEHEYDGTLTVDCAYVETTTVTDYTDGTEQQLTEDKTVIAFDGYGVFKDGTNPIITDLMINNTHISVLSGQNINIPFYKSGDNYTVYSRSGTTVIDTQTITPIEILNTTDAVEYLSFDSDGVNNIRVVNNDTLEEVILSVEVVDECTYEPIKCVFVNAKGVKQEFYFFKSSKESSSFKNESYKRSTLTTDIVNNQIVVSYDTNKHTNKVYNKQGQKSIEVNSGYIDEDNNLLIEELIMSEYVWLVIDGVVYPVDVDTKSLEYQTRLNDQLIKYKLKFKYSFDIKQNIR